MPSSVVSVAPLLVTLFSLWTPTAAAPLGGADFVALNSSVGGRLRQGVPFARACFQKVASNVPGKFDTAACSVAQANYGSADARLPIYGAHMNSQWETCQATGEGCLLSFINPTNASAFAPPRTCSLGSISQYFIDVRQASDIQAAYTFSKKFNIPLSIKNTGHDYKGRSSAPGSLALFTHNLNANVLSLNKNFVPQGCTGMKAQPAAVIGASITNGQVFDFADQNGVTIPGGEDPTVGYAGGFVQGGGHSIQSNAYGLAADRALEFSIVTPDGQVRVANQCQNSDLYFALRGGGGGTFGVLLSVTTQALPKLAFVTFFAKGFPDNAVTREALFKVVIANSVKWATDGWGGFIAPTSDSHVLYSSPTTVGSIAKAQADFKPVIDLLKTPAFAGGSFTITQSNSYLGFFDDFLAPFLLPNGLPFITPSRLVPSDNFLTQAKRDELLRTLLPALNFTQIPIVFANTPFFFTRNVPQISQKPSYTEVWTNSIWHVTANAIWDFDLSPAQVTAIYNAFSKNMDGLRKITPNGGAYLGESDVHEPNFEKSFWGSNYARLLSIKHKYDPDHLLDCWQCVAWQGPQDRRFKCYV